MNRSVNVPGKMIIAVMIIVLISGFIDQPVNSSLLFGLKDVTPVDKNNRIYMISHEGKRIVTWDLRDKTFEISKPLQEKPSKLYLSKDNKLLLLQGENDGKMLIFNPLKMKKEKEIPVGQYPVDIAESSKHYILCSRFPGEISFVSRSNYKIEKILPAGREPVAMAITSDEKLLFVAHLLPQMPATDENVAANIIVIDPVAFSIIKTINLPAGSTGVRGIATSPDGNYIFVTHILARFNLPTTQLERGWMNTNALSVIDTRKLTLWKTILLDDIDEGAANPWAVACPGNGDKIYVTHTGTHELSIINWKELKSALEKTGEGTGPAASENLSLINPYRTRIKLSGTGPRSITVSGSQAIICNYYSASLSLIDLATLKEEHVVPGKGELTSLQRGEMYFNDASLCFQGWQSCASCHPDSRVDGLNWDLMNDGIGNPKNTRSMLYSHVTPPVMSLGVRAHAKVAVRAGFKFIQFSDVPESHTADVDSYLESLTPDPSPYNSPEAGKGRTLFKNLGCASCHPEPYYTDLKSYALGSDTLLTWDTPALNELWRTAPYWHDGKYANLKDLFRKEKHGLENQLSEEELKQLEQYLLKL